MLVDISYFVSGLRHIANASIATMPSQDSIAVNSAIEEYIKQFQHVFLADMLGLKLASEITAYLDLLQQEQIEKEECNSSQNDEDPVDEKSKYEYVCEKLREPFADYVFFYILRDANEQARITGLVQLKCDNKYVSPIKRQVSIWNRMVKCNKDFIQWVSTDECPFNIVINNNMLTPINTLNL